MSSAKKKKRKKKIKKGINNYIETSSLTKPSPKFLTVYSDKSKTVITNLRLK